MLIFIVGKFARKKKEIWEEKDWYFSTSIILIEILKPSPFNIGWKYLHFIMIGWDPWIKKGVQLFEIYRREEYKKTFGVFHNSTFLFDTISFINLYNMSYNITQNNSLKNANINTRIVFSCSVILLFLFELKIVPIFYLKQYSVNFKLNHNFHFWFCTFIIKGIEISPMILFQSKNALQ